MPFEGFVGLLFGFEPNFDFGVERIFDLGVRGCFDFIAGFLRDRSLLPPSRPFLIWDLSRLTGGAFIRDFPVLDIGGLNCDFTEPSFERNPESLPRTPRLKRSLGPPLYFSDEILRSGSRREATCNVLGREGPL
jgi:hypothetical protein